MKNALTLIVFWLSVLTLTAQNQPLIVSGTVTNNSNGSPIPNHEVIIHNDSLSGTTGYFYRTVMTDYNGFYFDSIPLQPANFQGTVHIGTMDCQNYLNVYSASYGPQVYVIQHNFSICYSNPACSADFYVAPDSSSNNTFIFDPYGSGNITTWVWDFGDGQSSTITFPASPIVTHTYLLPDSYNACLTVYGSDSSCFDMSCVTLVAGNGGNCIANFTYSDSTNASFFVQFTDLSTSSGGAITSWSWNFGDIHSGASNTSTLQNPSHTFSYPDTYNVCLTIQGADSNCYDRICKTIDVGNNGGCIANFSYSDSTSASSSVQFTDLSQTAGGGPITSWFWNFGDPASGSNNASTSQNPVHTFSVQGNYNVCLTIQGADSNCYDMICKTIYVGGGAGCQAYFSYLVDSISVPAGTPVYFTDHSQGNPTSWTWSFGDGTGSSVQNPVHFYPTNGTYSACLTIYGDSCQDSYCTTIHIGNTPGCSSYFEHTSTYLSVNFQGYISNNNIPQWGTFTWSFGDGTTGQGQSVTHVYAQTGSYPINLTATDSSGCSSTYVEIITLYDSINTHQVYGQVFAGNNFPISTGFVMIFSLDSTANYTPYVNVATLDSMGIYYFTMVPDGNYYIYAIPILPSGYLPTYYGDVLDWQNATVIQLGQSNNPYDIHLLSAYTNPGGNGTINGQINMGQIKSSIVDKVTMILMNNDLQPIYYYKVNNAGDFTFPTLSFGTYYLKAEIPGVTSDIVKVEITQANPVASVTMTFSGNRILGIDGPDAILTAGILYPNPVSSVAYLSVKTDKAMTVQIDLYNLTGQSVVHFEKALDSGGTIIPITVSNLTKGIYTLRVHSDQGINIVRKLIK